MSWFSRVKAKLPGTTVAAVPDEPSMDRAAELVRSGDRPGAIAMLDRVISRAPSALAYYIVRSEVSTLGFTLQHRVVVADLGYGIDGLWGINFLRRFNFEIRPAERLVLVEKIAPGARGKCCHGAADPPGSGRSDPRTLRDDCKATRLMIVWHRLGRVRVPRSHF